MISHPESITAFLWAPELEAVLVCCTHGFEESSIRLLHLSDKEGIGSVEEVGAIEGGVQAASWSPSGLRLVLVSGSGRLLILAEVDDELGVWFCVNRLTVAFLFVLTSECALDMLCVSASLLMCCFLAIPEGLDATDRDYYWRWWANRLSIGGMESGWGLLCHIHC